MKKLTLLNLTLFASLAGINVSAQSVISLDSFDLLETPQEEARQAKPTENAETVNCMIKPDGDDCSDLNASSQTFSLEDVVNLGIVQRDEVEVPNETGEVVKVEDRVTPLPSIDLEILFDYNSANVRNDQLSSLITVSKELSNVDFSKAKLIIMGHTDGVGSDAYNKKLSLQRANSVADLLSEIANIPRWNIRTSGMGSDYLKDVYEPANPENRRVQIILLDV